MKGKTGLSLILAVLMISFVSAGFSVGNLSYQIGNSYPPEGKISGWINISFENEVLDSVFEGFGRSITLEEVLNQTGYNYECDPNDCESSYEGQNPAESKTFSLPSGEEKLVGLEFSGDLDSVEDISFDLQSNAQSSCTSQVKIDILDNGVIDSVNNETGGDSCGNSKNYGCYDDTKTTRKFELDSSTPFCQRVEVSESPSFNAGAWVNKNSEGTGVEFSTYNTFGDFRGGCDVGDEDISSEGGEVDCRMDIQTDEREEYYFVCMSKKGSSGVYETRGYISSDNACGFYGSPPRSEASAYQIFAESNAFGPVGTMKIEEGGSEITTYLQEKYDMDCGDGCVIPINIISGRDQSITLSNLRAEYFVSQAGRTAETNFFDVIETPAEINSEFQELSLNDMGIIVPEDRGNHTFVLSYKGESLIEEDISVENVPEIRSVSPSRTFAFYPTTFFASVNSSNNITEYRWNFGDGESQITTSNSVEYSYNQTGEYSIALEVTDDEGKTGEGEFNINVGPPGEVINTSINELRNKIGDVRGNISDMDTSSRGEIERVLNLGGVESELNEIERDFLSNSRGDEEILGDILGLEIPNNIAVSKEATGVQFYPDESVIDITLLDGSDSDSGNTRERVQGWSASNLNINLDFKEITMIYPKKEDSKIRIFDFSISEKEGIDYDYKAYVRNMNGLNLSSEWTREGDHYSKTLSSGENIRFSTTSEVDFSNVPFFIAPSLSNLGDIPNPQDTPEGEFNWLFFTIILILLILIGLGIYIYLHEWYQNRYETYLFKDRNNLFNIASYISESKQKGLSESKIKRNLKKAGWNSEQVNYAIRKYLNKRTGMFDLPFIEKVKRLFGKRESKRSFPKGPPINPGLSSGHPKKLPKKNPFGGPKGPR